MAPHPVDVLSVKGLTKRYGETPAVGGVSFCIRPNEIVGLLGPNGAGKTTIINTILGVLEPTSGEIDIEDVPLKKLRGEALTRTNFVAAYAPLPGNLTVAQNLKIFGLLYDVSGLAARIEELIGQFGLHALRNTKTGLLSSGEQARVGLAKALLNRPPLLLLDEPTASLDPSVARDVRSYIRDFSRTTCSGVLWTSHNMFEVQEVCDRVMFLSHGKILLEGDPRRLPEMHGAASLEDLFVTVAREPLSLDRGGLR